jgi:cytochrome oxidase assembly protein ShyY1
VALASWQIDRRSEAVSKIERVAANYDLNPVGFDEVAYLDVDTVLAYEWRSVELSGRYLIDNSFLVRNRAIAGQPGFVQLVPFKTETGVTITKAIKDNPFVGIIEHKMLKMALPHSVY